jgi:sugar/nucleoside kinase (ribokinase family)
MSADFDLLMIGHFAKDEIVVDGQSTVASGGGVYYGGIAARRLGARVAVATRLHPADFDRLAELEQTGISVFATPTRETSGIANYYQSADMERRVTIPLGFAGPFSAGDLPMVTARIYAIVPIIAGEVDLRLLEVLAARGPVALDIQGFVRVREGQELLFRPWPDLAAGLRHVTYLKVDRAEAEHLTGEQDLAIAARRLAGYGPAEIVITESAGVTVYAGGEIYRAPFTPRTLAGRTGRGDTCFATYLTARLDSDPGYAARLAGAVTTLKQEVPGPWHGTSADAEALLSGTRARI